MRYKPEYKQQKRQELLHISGQLAKQNGFAATGVDSFMKVAGVTSGAFYSHFSSKQDLFKALIETELQHSFAHWDNNPHQTVAEWVDFEDVPDDSEGLSLTREMMLCFRDIMNASESTCLHD